METLHTIINNFVILWNAPKDWSIDGGLSWLTFYLVCCVIGMVVFSRKEAKAERNARKAAIYREAEESGRTYLRMKSEKGFIERRNF